METNTQDKHEDDEDVLLYLCIDPMSIDDNIDFAVLSTQERAEILNDCETIYDYLDAYPWDVSFEIPVTARNVEKLKELVDAMSALQRARTTAPIGDVCNVEDGRNARTT